MNESYTTKRSSGGGQIPAFGNWEYANDLPITQYFESARQAGLIRHSSSSFSGECDLYMVNHHHLIKKPSPTVLVPPPPPPKKKTRRREMREKRNTTHVKEQGKQHHQVGNKKKVVLRDVTEPSTIIRRKTIEKNQVMLVHHHHADDGPGPTPKLPGIAVLRAPKPVDEDLYKISPDLLHYTSKRKKVLGFFPRCLLPPCVV